LYSIVLNVLKIENMTLKPYARATMENNAGDYKFLQDILSSRSSALPRAEVLVQSSFLDV
jgi:hypothetical protein